MKRLFICLLTAALLLCGCSEIPEAEEAAATVAVTEEAPKAYPVTVNELVFNSSPETVGSLSPAVTEMIFELGFGDRLVCRSSYCNYPEEAENIPQAGSGANPDFERLIELAPALLITQSPIANKDMTRLSEAGISVMYMSAPSSAEELYEMYEKLSLIFTGSLEGEEKAESAYDGLKSSLAAANDTCGSLAFILNITDDGFMAATGDTFAGDYISCFGENVFGDNRGFSVTVGELEAADPQVIFLARPLTKDDIDEDVADRLSAFSNGHVYTIDGSLMERPTARLAATTDAIAKKVREDIGG